MSYANSEGPDTRAHPCSLIWIFSGRTVAIDSVSWQDQCRPRSNAALSGTVLFA